MDQTSCWRAFNDSFYDEPELFISDMMEYFLASEEHCWQPQNYRFYGQAFG